MKKLMLPLFVMGFSFFASAQQIIQRDPAIEKMVNEVSADSLHRYINKLVSFHTRHTLSTINSRDTGIGAAREWVISKFSAFARESNGRMTVLLDKWTIEPDNKRVDVSQIMGNPMAILKGTDPADT